MTEGQEWAAKVRDLALDALKRGDKMSYLYLASPYSHTDPDVMHARYLDARDALAWLIKQRLWAYSPITHCHEIAIQHTLPRDAEFWWDYNRLMILNSRGLMVLRIDGWQHSAGVTRERDYALDLKLPVKYLLKRARNTFRIVGDPQYEVAP
jgi:Domain of unknown function (DUF1937)